MRAKAIFSAISGGSLLLTCVLVSACHEPEPESPEVGLTKPVHPPQPPDLGRAAPMVETETLYSIWLGEVQHVCGGPAPFFSFDSSKPDAGDQPTMQALSDCMVGGALKGKSILLIGHTDPRGTAQYNEKLGMERAERVKRYLVAHNVEPGRVKTETAGKEDASQYPSDWPKDRRVEVRLAQ